MRALAIAVSLLALGVAPASAAPAWVYEDNNDPVTDVHRGLAYVDADAGSLIIKCDEHGPKSLYVEFLSKAYLGGSGLSAARRKLIYRFDQAAPEEEIWRYNKNYAFTSDDNQVQQFLRNLLVSEKLIIRAETYEGENVDAVFAVVGASEALTKVAEACGQTLPDH